MYSAHLVVTGGFSSENFKMFANPLETMTTSKVGSVPTFQRSSLGGLRTFRVKGRDGRP